MLHLLSSEKDNEALYYFIESWVECSLLWVKYEPFLSSRSSSQCFDGFFFSWVIRDLNLLRHCDFWSSQVRSVCGVLDKAPRYGPEPRQADDGLNAHHSSSNETGGSGSRGKTRYRLSSLLTSQNSLQHNARRDSSLRSNHKQKISFEHCRMNNS